MCAADTAPWGVDASQMCFFDSLAAQVVEDHLDLAAAADHPQIAGRTPGEVEQGLKGAGG